MKLSLAIVAFIFISIQANSQNLVPNPDFENYGTVPCGWTSSASDFAAATSEWNSPTSATPDIFSTLISPSCSNYQPNSTDVSANGWQAPHSGDIFAGFYTQVAGSTWREYLQVQLLQPMISGLTYHVSMYISLSDNSQFATNNIGVAFSSTLTNSAISDELGYIPQINHTNVIDDTTNWVYLSDTIVCSADWQYIIIGNFFEDALTDIVNYNPGGYWDRSYYYADDIAVEEIIIDVASPNFSVTDSSICEKFCANFFDQSTNNPTSWNWFFPGGNPASSTDQNPTNICYNLPGTYDVTLITTNTNGSDTLTLSDYLTVYSTPPFPIITQNGTTLTASPADSYQWQLNSVNVSGATNQTYEATQSGIYSVIITDSNGCTNSATIDVVFTGMENFFSDARLSIYPNPSNGNFMIELLKGYEGEEIKIEIYNPIGRSVFTSEEKILNKRLEKWINLSGQPSGVYFLEIELNHILFNQKIMINN